MTDYDDDFTVAGGNYDPDEDPFEETPDELLYRLVTTDSLGDNAFEVGGGRVPAVPGHPNDWDFTIKWPSGTFWHGEHQTVRMNVHYRPTHPQGWTFGSMWIDGLQGHDININQTGPSQTLYNAVQDAWSGNEWSTPDPAGARF